MRIAVGRFVRTFERVRGPGRTGYCRPPAMGPLLPPRATPTAARFAQGASERAAWRRAREPRPSGERGIGRVLLDEWPIDGSMQRYTYTLARREFNNVTWALRAYGLWRRAPVRTLDAVPRQLTARRCGWGAGLPARPSARRVEQRGQWVTHNRTLPHPHSTERLSAAVMSL